MKDILIACCGLDCGACEARKATIDNDDNLRKEVARKWCEMNHTDQITPETINCMGCRTDGIKFPYCGFMCEIRKCTNAKGYETCAECSEAQTCEKIGAIINTNDEARKNILNA